MSLPFASGTLLAKSAATAEEPTRMNCVLCDKTIANYSSALHNLRIDDARAVDICDECIRKFVRWHGEKLAKLFPTKAMKKLHGRRCE